MANIANPGKLVLRGPAPTKVYRQLLGRFNTSAPAVLRKGYRVFTGRLVTQQSTAQQNTFFWR